MAKTLNDSSQWREFERNDVTHSAAHYLMAIDSLRQKYGYARVTDVADLLEVSRGAASMSLSTLKKRNWVAEDPNRFLLLTEEGERISSLVKDNFQILSKFLQEVLGVSSQAAMADACKMEHLMSLETGRRMLWIMRYVLGNPERAKRVQRAMACFHDGCESVDLCPICESEENSIDVARTCPYKKIATQQESTDSSDAV